MKHLWIYATIMSIAMLGYIALNNQSSPHNADRSSRLIVGTSADYPPYEKVDLATGKIIGFDIDVLTEVAHRLGKEIEIHDMPFNSLILHLISGQIDLIAAGLSATEQRKKAVLFSDVYLDSDYIVIVTKQNGPKITNLQDLHGKKVAVNTGYTADAYLSALQGIDIIRLDSPSESALALQANSVDAFATAKSSYNLFIEHSQDKDEYRYFVIPDTAEQCSFACAKHNTKLHQELNHTLAAMKADGTLDTIKENWRFND